MSKRVLLLASLAFAPCAWGQAAAPPGHQVTLHAANVPVKAPVRPSVVEPAGSGTELAQDGRCQSVRAGDTVRFNLKIESAEGAKAVFAELQLAEKGHRGRFREADLPLSRAGVMTGGGLAVRDAADFTLYHVSFAVPEVEPGMYRATGFAVRAAYSGNEDAKVRMDRHVREQVRGYCLTVFGGSHGPVMTEFLPRPVDHTAKTEPLLALR